MQSGQHSKSSQSCQSESLTAMTDPDCKLTALLQFTRDWDKLRFASLQTQPLRCAAAAAAGGPARHCVPRPSAAWHSLPDTMQQPPLHACASELRAAAGRGPRGPGLQRPSPPC